MIHCLIPLQNSSLIPSIEILALSKPAASGIEGRGFLFLSTGLQPGAIFVKPLFGVFSLQLFILKKNLIFAAKPSGIFHE